MQLTKKETRTVVLIAFLAAFVLSFNEWGVDQFDLLIGIENLTLSFIFCLIIYTCHVFAQKLVAAHFEHEINFKIIDIKKTIGEVRKTFTIYIGPILTLLVTLISNGKLMLLLLNTFEDLPQKVTRVGRKWIHLKEFEFAQIALAGPASEILLLILFKILTPLSYVFHKAMYISSVIAVFNMLPIPKVDGCKVFFGSRVLYLASLLFIIAFVVLIFHLSVIQTLILALILAFLSGVIYLYKLNS